MKVYSLVAVHFGARLHQMLILYEVLNVPSELCAELFSTSSLLWMLQRWTTARGSCHLPLLTVVASTMKVKY